jgi:hypothetical protein
MVDLLYYNGHPNHYYELFSDFEEFQHVTVEVFPFPSVLYFNGGELVAGKSQ